jgi:hypothetical protein
MLWRLKEVEAGEVLHDEFLDTDTELAAERYQADRWNRLYSIGEPRVSSRLYLLVSYRKAGRWVSRWRRHQTMGV